MTNYNRINQTFIRCSSHTLCGIKPANLFTVPSAEFSNFIYKIWENEVVSQGFSIAAFQNSNGLQFIFVYDLIWIRKILSDSVVQAYLIGKGYSDVTNATKALQILFNRLKNNTGFPHEVGIFLGYPIEDVISFEETQGHNCKYCGYWKSYCHPEEAKKCCERYKQCSELCKKWFEEGFSVPQIIKKYKEVAHEAA